MKHQKLPLFQELRFSYPHVLHRRVRSFIIKKTSYMIFLWRIFCQLDVASLIKYVLKSFLISHTYHKIFNLEALLLNFRQVSSVNYQTDFTTLTQQQVNELQYKCSSFFFCNYIACDVAGIIMVLLRQNETFNK